MSLLKNQLRQYGPWTPPPRPPPLNLSKLTMNQLRSLYNRGDLNYKLSRAILQAWVNKLVKEGTVNNLKSVINTNSSNLTNSQKNSLLTAWSIRRHSTPSLVKMLNHLSVGYNTKMGRSTKNSIRRELNRRRLT